MSPKALPSPSFSVETFSLPLSMEDMTDKIRMPNPNALQTALEQKLANCQKIVRWAIVRIEDSGHNKTVWCEGAYERLQS